MSTPSGGVGTPEDRKVRVSSYLYFGSLYFVTVGVLYLWGYWSPFGVNVLEYIGFPDVIKATAYPIASAFIFIVLGAVLGEGIFGSARLPPGGGANTRVGILLRRFRPVLAIMYALLTVGLLIYGPIEKWRTLPVLFALPVSILAKERGLFREQLKHESTRTVVIFIVAILPTYAYGLGRLSADEILSGKKYSYLVSGTLDLDAAINVSVEERPRFIGHAGDYVFFFEPVAKTLEIAKFDSGEAMVIGHFDRRSQRSTIGSNSSVERRLPAAAHVEH